MCWNYREDTNDFQFISPSNWGSEFEKNWAGGEWLEGRLGKRALERGWNTDDDDYTEDTTVTSADTSSSSEDSEVGFGSSVVGGESDPSLKRRQRGSKNRLRKMMRKDLKIPTGRSVVSVKGVA